MCFLAGWDEIIVVHDMLSNKIQDVSDFDFNELSANKVSRKENMEMKQIKEYQFLRRLQYKILSIIFSAL